ncbi:hypothetical protein O3G_MSEX006074 [Manduca sexta]|uniref:Uncharacterized protein n=1 Tax=Manduca sexta TaxID=7130 RepID=A0A922CKQ8_MANSE|nr:hypothetical protein O3G_MSEX006074 [Manduca sexta]
MGDQIIFCLLVTIIGNVASVLYFHEISPKLLNPDVEPGCDFGFSMGFQNTIPAKLIVGAPRKDFIGKVFQCTIIDIEENISCRLLNIDMDKIAAYSRNFNPNQYFYLGSTIAATDDYFLTCAPLWIPSERRHLSIKEEPYGTCFVYDKNFTRYNGTVERAVRKGSRVSRRQDLFLGGGGWTTLLDKNNGLILVAKTSFAGDIVYVPLESPLNDSKSLIELLDRRDLLYTKMSTFTNVGNALVAGNFFSNSTIYAFSMTIETMAGQVGFLEYNKDKQLLTIMTDKKQREPFAIVNKKVGSMFAAALAAEDLNKDGYSELIVGAPVQNDGDETSEQGAVYIYIGGDKNTITEPGRMRLISASKDGGRFGSAIAANDVDGDGIAELFISAPYEDSGMGAVYILSGYEISKLLRHDSKQQILLNELKFQQRVQAEGFRSFGYSLQIVSDLDDNGCNELAIGSPGSDRVLIYRCVPAINVTLSATLLGAKYVKEQADSFVVAVCVDIDHKPNASAIGNLIVDTSIVGYDAYMSRSKFIIDLSKGAAVHCENMTVKLSEKGEGEYDFEANVKMDLKDLEIIEKTKAFNTSWVTLRHHSETKKSIKIVRRCEAEDCNTNLTTSLVWSGAHDYVLGSSANETVSVTVQNSGHQSLDSCAWVKITGAPVRLGNCRRDGEGYKCMLSTPLKRDKKDTLNFSLNMTTPRSTDERLEVIVRVHENCDQPENTTHKMEVKYQLSTDHIHINGIAKDRNVTEKVILDDKIEIINDGHEYEIVNNGTVEWVNVVAVIAIDKKPFIHHYMASIPESNCSEKNETDKILFECNFNLMPHSRKTAIVTIDIQKDNILKNLINGKLNTTSLLTLYLTPKLPPLSDNATMFMTYLQERSLLNNKLVIVLGAVALAIIILAIFIYALYKANFFKRKQKKQLNELRESVRRRSMKKPSDTPVTSKTEEDFPGCRDSLMQNTSDNTLQEVHANQSA